jgi:hypothetical protein
LLACKPQGRQEQHQNKCCQESFHEAPFWSVNRTIRVGEWRDAIAHTRDACAPQSQFRLAIGSRRFHP